MLVGDVEEVLTVTSEQLEAVPTADTQTIESIAKIGDRLVILLNPEGLFARRAAPTSWPPPSPAIVAALSPNSAQRVVVADDSRLMRRILSDALGRQGFDVVATAADGDEALAACNEHRPDALTLDLHMPGLDGLGVLRALRAGKAEPVPVVVVSAFSPAHGARAVDALAEGAFDLVAKPAMGESMADFTAELAKKVNDAADSGKQRARRPRVVAATSRPPVARRRGPLRVRPRRASSS